MPRNWEIVTRKLLVLGEWGYPMDYFYKYVNDEDFLSEEFFEKYYGQPLDRGVMYELNAIDLLDGMKK